MVSNPIIYSVIASFNGEKWISKCLKSLAESSIENTIIVVDNNSSDNTVQIIEEQFPEVILFKEQENLGFGKANNIGISYALQHKAEYVFLLNQDAYLEENTLKKLVDVTKLHSDFGILSPLQLNWEGTQLEHYFTRFAGVNKHFYSDHILKNKQEACYEVPFINAAAWLLPAATLKVIGGFDPIFQHYGEDNNYCQRLLYHGFKIGVVPGTYIFHDSKDRSQIPEKLFTAKYYRDEVLRSQVKFADLNKADVEMGLKKHRNRNLNLIIINLLKLKIKHVQGYLKKYLIYGKVTEAVMQSRKINSTKGAHYLNLD